MNLFIDLWFIKIYANRFKIHLQKQIYAVSAAKFCQWTLSTRYELNADKDVYRFVDRSRSNLSADC